jgi:hypothetical protein
MTKPNPNKAIHVPMGRKSTRNNSRKKQQPQWTPITTTNVRFDAWGDALRTLKANGVKI